nr:PEdeltaIII-LC3-KDEL3 [Synthetic plasmid]
MEEAFDLWNECAKACVLDLKDGVRSSRMSVDPAIADTNGQGVLHYSMVLEGGNDALKLAIDNALSITSDGLTIRLEGGVEPNKPVRYSYTRQARGSWSLNWLVPIGHEKPSNIKVFIHELNAGNQLSHMSPIYTIEMGDELLAKLARDATFFVRAHESNEMQPTLAISHAGVSVVMAQTQPRREKRWSEWASGKVLCLLDPLDGVYNYLAQQRCNLDDTWEGKIYRVLAGNPAKHDLDIKPTVISHRLHFPEGGSLAALTAHQACHLPLETFTRHRQPRGWEQLEQCGYPVQRLVALYLAARLSWNQVDQVIRNALASPGSGGDLGEAIREQPEQARLALTLAAAESERFVRQGTGNDEAGAANADVVSLTCPVAAGEKLRSKSDNDICAECSSLTCPADTTYRTYTYDSKTGTCKATVKPTPSCSVCEKGKFVEKCKDQKLERKVTLEDGKEYQYNIPKDCVNEQCIPRTYVDCLANDDNFGEIYKFYLPCQAYVTATYHYSSLFNLTSYKLHLPQSEEFMKEADKEAYCTYEITTRECKTCSLTETKEKVEEIDLCAEETKNGGVPFKCKNNNCIIDPNFDCQPIECKIQEIVITEKDGIKTTTCKDTGKTTCDTNNKRIEDARKAFIEGKEGIEQVECASTVCQNDNSCPIIADVEKCNQNTEVDYGCKAMTGECDGTTYLCKFVQLTDDPSLDSEHFRTKSGVELNNACLKYKCVESKGSDGKITHKWEIDTERSNIDPKPRNPCETATCDQTTRPKKDELRDELKDEL